MSPDNSKEQDPESDADARAARVVKFKMQASKNNADLPWKTSSSYPAPTKLTSNVF